MTTGADLLSRYLADPQPATLAALRRAVRAVPGFRADLAVGDLVGPLLQRGEYAEAVEVLRGLMPGALLSPSAHAALAEALTGAGHRDDAAREARLARAAVSSVLSTGDGSRERPWSVLRVSDEYDVLRVLGRRPRQQSLGRHGDRYLDHHVCADGSEVFFDVTELFPPG